MINFKLKKTTFEGMKISLDEEILFLFDKGINVNIETDKYVKVKS